MVVTVLIIGILAAAAAPRYASSLVRIQVEAAARQVAADLRHARQRAKTAGVPQSVVFTPASDSYDLPGLTDLNRADRSYTVDLAESGYPATIVSASFGAGGMDNTVVFDMHGRPAYGGTVVVQVSSEQRTIAVDAFSGHVSIKP